MSPRLLAAARVISHAYFGVGVVCVYAPAVIRGFLQTQGQRHRGRPIRAMPPRRPRRHSRTGPRPRPRVSAGVVIGVVQIVLMLVTLMVMLRGAPPAPTVVVKVIVPSISVTSTPSPDVEAPGGQSENGGARCAPIR
jgi:hypothetical protein